MSMKEALGLGSRKKHLATPNWRHAEFAVPALQAGIHVLLEKLMEVSVAECEQILEAQRRAPRLQAKACAT